MPGVCHIKLAFFLIAYVLGYRFRTLGSGVCVFLFLFRKLA